MQRETVVEGLLYVVRCGGLTPDVDHFGHRHCGGVAVARGVDGRLHLERVKVDTTACGDFDASCLLALSRLEKQIESGLWFKTA